MLDLIFNFNSIDRLHKGCLFKSFLYCIPKPNKLLMNVTEQSFVGNQLEREKTSTQYNSGNVDKSIFTQIKLFQNFHIVLWIHTYTQTFVETSQAFKLALSNATPYLYVYMSI